jgi:protein-arginine kinase activator protein McsA
MTGKKLRLRQRLREAALEYAERIRVQPQWAHGEEQKLERAALAWADAPNVEEKRCERCKTRFQSYFATARFCSSRCNGLAAGARQRARAKVRP